ncbi:MAG TPA: tail fiber domain-containing protein [Candidatus Dormibacteraeota bacterium]|nr:tail fiber domain-containing protein [Candidatus Dormibacteraeota bacterium]
MNKRSSLTIAAAVCNFFLIINCAFAQGTAFTYQGRLTDGASAANGTYDFRFTLLDSTNLPGTVVAGPVTNAATVVSNGLFTVTLDFGSAVLDGSSRFLEIAARTNLGGTGSFSSLSPRQKLTSTPYAVRAANSGLASGVTAGAVTASMLAPGAVSSLDTPNGSTTGLLRVANTGLIGVGTTNSQAGLEVDGGKTILAPTLLNVLVDGSGTFTNLGGPCSLAVNGNLLAILGQDDNAFTLVDMAVPTNIVMLSSIQNGTGSFTNLGLPTDVAWSGNLLAITANSSNAVTLVDTTSPSAPVLKSVLRDGVGGFNDLGGAFSLNLTSNLLAIAAATDNAVSLVDVSNPLAPVLRVVIKDGTFGFNDLSGPVGVARQGNLLAVASENDNAVSLIDISNPSSPVLRSVLKDGVGAFTNLAVPFGLAFSGNLLAIGGANDAAVTLVDVSNPASPVLLSSVKNGVRGFEGLGFPARMAFQGTTLWIADNSDGVTALDISNPSAPTLRCALRNGAGGFNHLSQAISMAVRGNVVIAGASSAVNFLDVTTTTQVGLVSQQWVGIGVTQPKAALDVRGNVVVEDAQSFDVHTITAALGKSVASGIYATALGNSVASGDYSTAMGSSTASQLDTTAGGQSTASAERATAFGASTASGPRSFAAGQSFATAFFSTALGVSTANGNSSLAAGGDNQANGAASVALGESCVTSNNFTFALGQNAKAIHQGAFVWADSQIGDFTSTSNNQFLIRAGGGVGIGTASPTRELEVQGASDVELGLKSTDTGSHLWTLQSSSITGNPALDGSFQIIDRTSGGSRLLIGTNGHVGIHSTSPQGDLHVNGSTVLQGLVAPSSTVATNLLNLGSGVTADGFRNGISFYEASGAMAMSVGYDGTGDSAHNALRIYNNLGSNLFTFQANGNMGIGTNSPQQALSVVGNIISTGTVNGTSDRSAKTNFAAVNPREVLDKVAALPISRWNYKSETDVTHLGPMAQDFYAAFSIGMDDKHISMVDADGVALAAIQGLNQKLEQTRAENAELKQELLELKNDIASLRKK